MTKNQGYYKVLSRFQADATRPVSTSLTCNKKLINKLSPKIDDDHKHMKKFPWAIDVSFLTYVMLYTITNNAYAAGIMST